jgi:hypothetical protein
MRWGVAVWPRAACKNSILGFYDVYLKKIYQMVDILARSFCAMRKSSWSLASSGDGRHELSLSIRPAADRERRASS